MSCHAEINFFSQRALAPPAPVELRLRGRLSVAADHHHSAVRRRGATDILGRVLADPMGRRSAKRSWSRISPVLQAPSASPASRTRWPTAIR